MRPIVMTTDPVLLSFAKTILADAGIEVVEMDQFTSAIEGSVAILPHRLLVQDGAIRAARDALSAAGLGKEVIVDDGDAATPSRGGA